MANKISLTSKNIEYLRYAFAHFFPEDTIYAADKPYVSGEFNWKNRADFIDFIYRLTGIYIKSDKDLGNIKKAQIEIEKLTSGVEETENKPESNLPDKEARQLQELERQRRETEIKTSVEQAKKEVGDSIQKQQKLAEDLKGKRLYIKTEVPQEVEVTEGQKRDIETLRVAAKADPQKLVDQIAQTIESKIGAPPDGTSSDEVRLSARRAAYETVNGLLGQSPAEEIAVLKTIGGNDYTKGTIPNVENRNLLVSTAGDVAQEKLIQYIVNRDIVASTFGEPFANSVFGPQNPELIKVDYVLAPQEGFSEYKLDDIPQKSIFSSDSNVDFLNNVRGYAEGEIKSSATRFASSKLESLISRLPKDSFLAKTYNNELVQGVLSRFGMASSLVTWEGTAFFGRIAVQSGLAPVLNWVGAKTGIDFGIKKVTSALGKQVGAKIAQGAATKAAGEAAGTAVTTAATGAGSLAGPLGSLIGLVVGWLTSKIIDKIPWKKIAPWLLGGIVGVGAFMTGGLWAGIATGLLVGGALSIGTGAVTLGAIGLGAIRLAGAIGSVFVMVFGPALMAIVLAPIVIALILFIINSGAYVVPPTTSSVFATISCTQEKQLSGITYPTNSPIASRALDIVDDLYQGFWCYWNRSPKAPPEYFPDDVLLHPPGYPELFDYKLFLTNPTIPESAGPNLFWCTYLVVKAYSENQTTVPYELNTQNMFNAWAKDKVVSADKATSTNILPGSVVFFHVTTGPSRLNHVGIVYSVDPGGIVMVQSNAPLKTQTINFKAGGVGAGDLPFMEVKYFGLP